MTARIMVHSFRGSAAVRGRSAYRRAVPARPIRPVSGSDRAVSEHRCRVRGTSRSRRYKGRAGSCAAPRDRKSGGEGKSGAVRVGIGGRRDIKQNNNERRQNTNKREEK